MSENEMKLTEDTNPYRQFYTQHCEHCTNGICKAQVYNAQFSYNDYQKKIVMHCAEMKQILKNIKESN